MSLTRSFLNEFRPLFRLLEEPLFRPTSFERLSHPHPFHRGEFLNAFRPNVYVAEQPKAYVVEAEVPGVRKEDLNVRVGDNGQSIVIEGKLHNRWGNPELAPSAEAAEKPAADTTAVNAESADSKCSICPSSPEQFLIKSTFTRTVWLPRPVDGQNVSAKLQDGVLTLTVPKMEDKEAIKIVVE
ncbi:hypothetical protein BOTBODRAFT_162752 [Botryobasidium botryosum FD-172 SS1]|uniref:SHSP domain-containing protein n=1 Tax=Botryobasidium botryosum (strain FD-172 SS1) TaxID=930990 RepID=A0A067M9Q0_BOTB1|nr:hypothetical protein BOTBODRAFT_162752 [Botryobasidium botryosum FD-172 SS1]